MASTRDENQSPAYRYRNTSGESLKPSCAKSVCAENNARTGKRRASSKLCKSPSTHGLASKHAPGLGNVKNNADMHAACLSVSELSITDSKPSVSVPGQGGQLCATGYPPLPPEKYQTYHNTRTSRTVCHVPRSKPQSSPSPTESPRRSMAYMPSSGASNNDSCSIPLSFNNSAQYESGHRSQAVHTRQCSSRTLSGTASLSTSTAASVSLSLDVTCTHTTSSTCSTADFTAVDAKPGKGSSSTVSPASACSLSSIDHTVSGRQDAISQMLYWLPIDTKYSMGIAEHLQNAWGLSIATELASAVFPAASSHPKCAADMIQYILGHKDMVSEQVWAMHMLIVRAPKSALEALKAPLPAFQPYRALHALHTETQDPAIVQSIVCVLHHAAVAGAQVAMSLDLMALVATCQRLNCNSAVRDLLVALWQQDQHATDAAHNCLALLNCPHIRKEHTEMSTSTLEVLAGPGTVIQECCMLVPIGNTPYFARHFFAFPSVPLADVAPAANQVASSTLGTGIHGVVIRVQFGGQELALKVPYRTAEASMGLQTELEAHMRIWKVLSEKCCTPSRHLCLAGLVVYTEVVSEGGTSARVVDGLAMPCVDGTLWSWWQSRVGGQRGQDTGRKWEGMVAWMAFTLACGLCSLHSAACVHNDLHPQNVGVQRVSGEGFGGAVPTGRYECHVLDLGRVITSGTTCDRFQQLGKFWPAWYAPEAMTGSGCDARKVDLQPEADMWAFGCILVSILRGSAPAFTVADTWNSSQWEMLASGRLWLQALDVLPQDSVGLKEVAKLCLQRDVSLRCSAQRARESLAECVALCRF